MRNGLRVIDADAHFYEPSDIWDRYMEPEYYDRRPRVIKVHGKAILEYEGVPMHTGSNADSLFSLMEEKFGHAYRENWSLESRLADMKQEGWDIQVCLPTNGAGETESREPDLAGPLCRAYNNWARDFCAGAPERVKFTAITPWENIQEMLVEAKRAIEELQAVSVFLPKAIPDLMWHHPSYDAMWEQTQELDFPLSMYGEGCASGQPQANTRYLGGKWFFVPLGEAISFPFENMISLAHFIYSGLLDRFPRLRLLLLESNAGWLPFWLSRLERYCHGRQAVFFDEPRPKLTPEEYFRRQCAIAADADEPTLKYVVDYIGDDNVVFNTDYPHPDAPVTSAPLRDIFAQPIPESSRKKILWGNSVRVYGERLIKDHPLSNH
jgi:predicted TIM-barrel fold metal-dependent hydrolase